MQEFNGHRDTYGPKHAIRGNFSPNNFCTIGDFELSDKKPTLADLGLDAPNSAPATTKSWQDVANEEARSANERHCRFCGKLVHVDSMQCAYCKKVIKEDHPLRASQRSLREPWNGAAAVLSFLVPGLGQIFKGHVGRGLMLFIFTLIGYAIFILPGIIIHVLTVLDAGSEKKWLA